MNYSKQNNDKKRKEHMSKKRKAKNKAGIMAFRITIAAILIFGFWFGGVCLGAYFGIIENAPKLTAIQTFEANLDTIIYDNAGEIIARINLGESREYATLEQIPVYLKYAFIAIEDERFYSHNGVDFQGFIRGIYEGVTTGEFQGGSTITQQYVKNRLGYIRNTIETKLQEQYLAMKLEKEYTEKLGSKEAAKEYIVELYMNIIGLGHGTSGVQAASQYYFGKDVSELTIAECAVISAITQNPYEKDPIRFPENNRIRQMKALDNMLEFGFITQEQYDEAVEEDVYSKVQKTKQISDEKPSLNSYFVDQVIEEIISDLQDKYTIKRSEASRILYGGGLKVYTTMDSSVQKAVDDVYADEAMFLRSGFEIDVTYKVTIRNTLTGKDTHYEKKGTVKTWNDVDPFVEKLQDSLLQTADEIIFMDQVTTAVQPQSGMVVMDHHTGYVSAIAGGRGDKQIDRGFNRATAAYRQPGSVFKVLAAYLPAIDLGRITAATVIEDMPYTYTFETGKKYEPNNWYSTPDWRGLHTVRTGIRDSMNILAVKTMVNTGLMPSYEYLQNLGFTKLDARDITPATALGGITYGVSQLEIAAAYGAIANEGVYLEPTFYTKVLDNDGNVLLEYIPEPTQVIKKTTAFLLTDMMKDVINNQYGTGYNARFRNSQMPTAGKTGTTSASFDFHIVGYTPYYVASVYIGYDQPKTIEGAAIHTEIWQRVMEKIHENLEVISFPMPESITTASVCMISGKLAVTGLCSNDPVGNAIKTEYFAAGTVPTEYCDVHLRYRIDVTTGKIPMPSCPSENIQERIGRIYREPYYGNEYIRGREYSVPQAILNNEYCPGHAYTPPPEPEQQPESEQEPLME